MADQEMLVNYVPGEESRIAIVENGRLEEFYQERVGAELHVGNIYKGRIVGVEPSIQAVFIDFGLERNGFLHITDLHPMYFPGQWKEESERVGQKTPHRDRPPIQSCLRRGQEILVQVLKEGIGTKGPTLTSYLSIPGRFLVMMPHMHRLGVSRKVEDEDARREMRKILDELNPPEGYGFIIRTAGIGRTKTEIKRDLAYLYRLWKAIETRRKKIRDVGELYTESDLIIRTIRDVFTSQIKKIIVDHAAAARRARNFLAVANPRAGCDVMVYQDPIPLFHRYKVEQQIDNINARHAPLPSGGSLVIDSAEALVAIDVNSGKNRENRDAETTAYKTNVEAADEVCRQLRLRDLGGVIAIDLIDMRHTRHRRDIEQRFRKHLKNDRARTRVLPISQLGVLEMTRQRMRPSLKKSIYIDCPACQGSGLVKSPESVVLDAMRRLAVALERPKVSRVELTISPDAAFVLLNHKRGHLVHLEEAYQAKVIVRVGGQRVDYIQLTAFDDQNRSVETETVDMKTKPAIIHVDQLPDDSAVKPHPSAQPDDAAAFERGVIPDADAGSFEDDRPGHHEHGDDQGNVQSNDQGNDQRNDQGDGDEGKPSRRRRRRRGGRRRNKRNGSTHLVSDEPSINGEQSQPGPDDRSDDASEKDSQPGSANEDPPVVEEPKPQEAVSDDETQPRSGRPKRRRRRSGRKKTSLESDSSMSPQTVESSVQQDKEAGCRETDNSIANQDGPQSSAATGASVPGTDPGSDGGSDVGSDLGSDAPKKRSRSRRRPRKKTANISNEDRGQVTGDPPPGGASSQPVTVELNADLAKGADHLAEAAASEASGG